MIMKNIISIIIIAAITTSCNSASNNSQEKRNSDTTKNRTSQVSAGAVSINKIIAHYLEIKNALANDDGKKAATHGKELMKTVERLDTASLDAQLKKIFNAAADDLKENAEHISTNSDKIDHQREHFEMLSQDVYDLAKSAHNENFLYRDYCPMYNDNKGAMWLSEIKEIKNPYLGKKMPTCGEVREEIK
jgi:hypothetical protein